MNDSHYINTYVDFAVGTIHEYLTLVLQLKTQLKVANDVIGARDQQIGELLAQIEQYKQEQIDRSHLQYLEAENVELKNRTSNLDGALSQIADMKLKLREKEEQNQKQSAEIESLNKEILSLNQKIEFLKQIPEQAPVVTKKKKQSIKVGDDF